MNKTLSAAPIGARYIFALWATQHINKKNLASTRVHERGLQHYSIFAKY